MNIKFLNRHAMRPFMFAVLAALALMGEANASIDVGTTATSVYDQATHQASTNIKTGVFDEQSGLQWIKATTLAEGGAQGFRAATSAEFSAFLSHEGWVKRTGAGAVYQLPAPTSILTAYSWPAFGSDAHMYNGANFPEYHNFDASMGWLNGVAGGDVGAIFTTVVSSYMSNCDLHSNYCSKIPDQTTRDALVADVKSLAGGAYDSFAPYSQNPWSKFFSTDPASYTLTPVSRIDGQVALSYFMVAAIPEPGSIWMMLIGGGGSQWRGLTSSPPRQGELIKALAWQPPLTPPPWPPFPRAGA